MRPYRYRCALVPALLCAGLFLMPQRVSAQGMFNSRLQSTIHEMINLISKAAARDMSRGKMKLLDNALMDLVRVLEDRGAAHHHHHRGHFSHGMHHVSNSLLTPRQHEPNHGSHPAMPTSNQRHQEQGGFSSGLRTASNDVANLLGMAVSQHRSLGEVRRLDDAFHDLMRVLEHRPASHSRFAVGAKSLTKANKSHHEETRRLTKNTANTNAVGNLTGRKDHTMRQQKTMIPPPTKLTHAIKGAGNQVGIRAIAKSAPTNPATAAIAKNAPHHPLRPTVASAKIGITNPGISPIAKAGPVTHSIRMADNNPANFGHARYAPAAFKSNPTHNFVPAIAKAAPVNVSAGRRK